MRRKSKSQMLDGTGLVPMADMLSNTVGIMLFILTFTVLHTGGVWIPKRLPMEHKTKARPLYFVCQHKRLIPFDVDLSDKLFEGLEKPTYETAEAWIAKFNRARAENDYFSVTPDGRTLFNRGVLRSTVRLLLSADFKPKENVGDTMESIDGGNSHFDQYLRNLSKSDKFVFFMVYPDSVDLFRIAREHAKTRYNIGSGWGPIGEGEPIRISLSRGQGVEPQMQ